MGGGVAMPLATGTTFTDESVQAEQKDCCVVQAVDASSANLPKSSPHFRNRKRLTMEIEASLKVRGVAGLPALNWRL